MRQCVVVQAKAEGPGSGGKPWVSKRDAYVSLSGDIVELVSFGIGDAEAQPCKCTLALAKVEAETLTSTRRILKWQF
ncbi:predicted protein [Pyrenophora tritici-repentis Pt-1C-BFP]|uniref:Uncharacterized protein n=1 Tax=Pyrenophora tritici-repentis (strain Pt-1C-BFP) TaxID=426418 RepID=B2VSF8_PYRTR|nr:uncharacterized protein PTRG_00662 [Pyrenophora tritici-repentis Pt-1C-BFP]EDU40100.1 predicted protein [Pyrenophora tritici-repentis Pt-1C-BFP]